MFPPVPSKTVQRIGKAEGESGHKAQGHAQQFDRGLQNQPRHD